MQPQKPNRQPQPFIPAWGFPVIGGALFLILIVILGPLGIGSRIADSTSTFFAGIGSFLKEILIFCGLAAFYMLPWLISCRTPRSAAIFVTNLVFGWTIIGWIVALIWALAESGSADAKKKFSNQAYILAAQKRHRSRRDESSNDFHQPPTPPIS